MAGLLTGAMAGLGRGVSDIAGGHIANNQRMDLQREQMALEEQKQIRQMQWQERMDARSNQRRQAALAEMPDGLSRVEQAEWLQRRGMGDDAKFQLDAAKASDLSEYREGQLSARQRQLELQGELNEARAAAARASAGARESEDKNMNTRQNDAIRELQMRFGTRDSFGVFSLDEQMRDQYEAAYSHLLDLLDDGVAPARAADQAYRRVTRQPNPTVGGAGVPQADHPLMQYMRQGASR